MWSVIFIAVFAVAVYFMAMAYWKQQRRGLEAHKKLKARASHNTPRTKMLPPRKALSADTWTQEIVTTIQKTRGDGEPVYRDDFDEEQVEDYLTRVAEHMSLSEEEHKKLMSKVRATLDTLPKREENQDDTCPECGELFAVTDDYLCPKCRALLG